MFEYESDVATEFFENVWKTSEWIPQMLVNEKLRKLAKEGKVLPKIETVENVIKELTDMIKRNGGITARKPLDFGSVLERLEMNEHDDS